MYLTQPLEIIRYRAWFETRGHWHLLDYPGSTWRGAFGHALRRAACTQPHTECGTCPERRDCPYPGFFDAESRPEPPRPYILEPHAYTGFFADGTPIGLDFVLLGWANGWLQLIIDALTDLGQQGLGLRPSTRLHLMEIQQEVGPTGGAWATIYAHGSSQALPLPASLLVPPPPPSQARLELLTPLKIKFRGLRVEPDNLTGRDVLIAIARRCEACAQLLPTLPLPPTPEEWLSDADSLIQFRKLGTQETHHYSSRQREDLKLGGLIGHVILSGPALKRAWPWLWLGQWLHLGSSTTSGLGRYLLQPLTP